METNNISSRWIPVNDSNPRCIKTDATLCIYNVDPDIITQKLGILPTGSQAKDRPSILPSGKIKTGRVNSWLLSSEDIVSSKDLRTHLDWLLDKILPVVEKLKEIQQIPDVKISTRCSWWSVESDGAGIVLWPEQMDRLAKANLELSLEIACWGESEEEIKRKPNDNSRIEKSIIKNQISKPQLKS